MAIRIGALGDSSLIARPIGQQQVVTIASRALVSDEPIESLGDLALHRCLSFRFPSTGRERVWTFRAGTGGAGTGGAGGTPTDGDSEGGCGCTVQNSDLDYAKVGLSLLLVGVLAARRLRKRHHG